MADREGRKVREKLRSIVREDIQPSSSLAALAAGTGRSIYGESDWKQFEAHSRSQISKDASQFLASEARFKGRPGRETSLAPTQKEMQRSRLDDL